MADQLSLGFEMVPVMAHEEPCAVCRGEHPPCAYCGEYHCELDPCPDPDYDPDGEEEY